MSDRFKKIGEKLLPVLKNKFVLVIIVFMVWITFFDQNNLVDRANRIERQKQLEKEKIYYRNKIDQDSTKLHQLRTSDHNLEEFAREQYYMKKEDEDIFIIVEEE